MMRLGSNQFVVQFLSKMAALRGYPGNPKGYLSRKNILKLL
jgi:hypothetical protein